MLKFLSLFWKFYERFYLFNLLLTVLLFSTQIIHLVWLSFDVVIFYLFDFKILNLDGFIEIIILIVDYVEIPALISANLLYINELRKKSSVKNFLYLLFLNIQFVHIFWITDEFVVEQFSGLEKSTIMPLWLSWLAIFIDYLELPVIFDTIRRLVRTLLKKVKVVSS